MVLMGTDRANSDVGKARTSTSVGTATTAAVPPAVRPADLLKPVLGRLYGVAMLSVVTAVATVIPLLCVIEIADHAGDESHTRLWILAGILVIAAAIKGAASAGAGFYGHVIVNDVQLYLRSSLIAHIRRVPLGWIDSRRSSGIVAGVEGDVASVHHMVAHTVHETVVAILVPVISLVALFIVDWQFALIAVVPVIVTFLVMAVMLSTGAQKQQTYNRANENMAASVVEFVRGISVMKAFNVTAAGMDRYADRRRSLVEAWSDWSRQSNVYLALIDILTSPVTILLMMCAVGVGQTREGTPIGLIAGIVLGLGLAASIVAAAMNSEALISGISALGAIAEVLSTEPVPEPAEPVNLGGAGPLDATVVMEDVTFGYGAGDPVIQGISIEFAAGTTTALVGASGAGKSTVATLLARFHDPTTGRITLGGHDLREVATGDLYRHIGVVFQDPLLLSMSLRDNIRISRASATDDEIMDAARRAHIADDILNLPNGLDTVLGVEVELSSGQAQRVAIARAFVTRCPVLILDEPTAYADPDSEESVRAAVAELSRDRTVIMIAHRLSTVAGAAQIVVLDSGRVVERGRPEDLLKNVEGHYAKLWRAYGADAEISASAAPIDAIGGDGDS